MRIGMKRWYLFMIYKYTYYTKTIPSLYNNSPHICKVLCPCIKAKYGIIMLSYKTYAYYRFFQNAFPPYPIVTDSLVSFQYEGQLSFA